MLARFVRFLLALAAFGALVVAPSTRVGAATITASYVVGHRDVLINDYGTPALGTFRLRDGDTDHVALCIEAHQPHTTVTDAYSPVPNRVVSAELDALLWWLSANPPDADTATAAAALAWYYADAKRSIGPPVWSNGARGFARIGPDAPEPWDSLPQFSRSHPVGLRSGSRNLDGAERTVLELHRMASSLAGPWTLTADGPSRRVQLTGRSGPLAGQLVSFTIAAASGTSTVSATTDEGGWATPALPALPDGATVTASVSGPGVHREWDGGGIQRMVTPTTAEATASFEIAPLPRHIVIQKRSSDPSIGVEGAEFDLLDVNGAVVASARTDASGRAVFAPFDPATHPGPYTVRERVAPPGLVPAADTPVATASVDPTDPTLVEIVDHPAHARVRVRKILSEPAGPDDRSGFGFSVVRADGGLAEELVTGPDGISGELQLAIGSYRICETATPDWAAGFVDGGCLDVSVSLDDVSTEEPATLTFDYLNVVPTTTTSTTTTTTVAPTTQPPPETTAPEVSTTSTTTTSTTNPTSHAPTTTAAEQLPPAAPPQPGRPDLPRTGADGVGRLLHLADIGFVVGVALVAAAGLLPRRERGTAGR